MRERERQSDSRPQAADGSTTAGNLDGLRQRAQRHLEARASAIDRVLSSDSEKFLAATRQHGGQ